MENTSNSGIKKNSRQLKFYLDKSHELSSSSLYFLKSLELSSNIKKTNSEVSAHYSLAFDSISLIIKDNTQAYNNSLLLPNTENNAEAICILYDNLSSTEYDYKRAKKSLLKNLKSESSYYKNIKRVYPQSKDSILIELLSFKDELSKLRHKCSSLILLPVSLLSLKSLSSYESCQILIHEKGNLEIKNFSCGPEEETTSKNISVQSFNSIYSHIKKSKNKQFNQNNFKQDNLNIVGSFLAKDLELKNHSIILILSRNDFLPASTIEIEKFENLSDLLIPMFDELLLNEKQEKKLRITRLALENYPQSLLIRSKINGSVLFSNKKHFSKSDEQFTLYDLKKDLDLVIYQGVESSTATDIHHQQRVQLLGELLNTLQHELSNPLFGLKLSSDLLLMDSEDEEIKETLTDISENSLRCQTIIESFSLLYKKKHSFQKIDIHKLLKETITLTKSASKEISKIIVTQGLNVDKQLYVTVNPTWISQIVFNLIINSSQAIKSISKDFHNHKIIIGLINNVDSIQISVSDSGPGVLEENNNKITEAFFTTKKEGTGLGLSICKSLALKLGGTLSFKNNSDRGVSFTLELPK